MPGCGTDHAAAVTCRHCSVASSRNWRSGHCQTKTALCQKPYKLAASGRQLTPLGQGGSAVLLEDIATVEVAVVVEVVVDRGVDGCEFL